MAHTYASVAQFNDFLRDSGSVTFAAEGATIVARKLAALESASRRVDAFCARSAFESGFGPRLGTNRYTPDGTATLYLFDDLISITSVNVKSSVAEAAVAFTDETDFYKKPYDRAPYRQLVLHGNGSYSSFYETQRGTSVTGKWGYQDVRRTATATASAIGTTSTTSVTVSAATEFSPGQTILIESEQMYVRSIAASVLTVVRGANGTTAATHGAASAIDIYEYPEPVVDAVKRIALVRERSRDAGADGSDGGQIPVVVPRHTELSILKASVSHLAYAVIA